MEFRKSVYSKVFCALSEKKTTTTKVIRSLNLSHSLLHTPIGPKPLWIRILDCNSPQQFHDIFSVEAIKDKEVLEILAFS